jgi:tetratricopeptide (TPR) repeat protein
MWTSCLLFLAVLEMYLLTHCASFNINDSGETILVCTRLTISHSPGYPLHMLWGKFNNVLFPFGQPMLRVTMASIWTASLSVVLFFQILKRAIVEALSIQTTGDEASPRWMSEVPALAGAWMFACSYQQWFQAGGAKGGVYTLNTFLYLSMVVLLLRVAHRGMAGRASLLVCFLFGLGLAHHWPNIVVMIPVYVWMLFSTQTKLTTHELRNITFSPMSLALFASVFLLSSLVFLTGADPKPIQGNPFFDIIMTVGKAFLIGLAPVALLLLSKIFDWASIFRFMSAALLGLTPYVGLAIRSNQHPVVSWWNPNNCIRLWETVIRKGYSNIGDPRSLATLIRNVKRFWFAVHDQFGYVYTFLIFALAITGFVWLWRRRPALAVGFVGLGASILISSMIFSNPAEGYQWTLDNFFTPCHLTIAFFAAVGLTCILVYLRSGWAGSAAAWVLASLVLFVGGCPMLLNWVRADQSRYVSSYDYGMNMVKGVDRNGVILCNGDIDILPLWYVQYVLGKRTEVANLTMQLIPYDWYRNPLFEQYPFLKVPVTEDIRPQTVVQNMITQHASERSFYFTNIFTAPWMRQQNPSMTEGFMWRITNSKGMDYPFTVERSNLLWSSYRLRWINEPDRGYWDEYTDVMKDSYGIGHDFMGYYCFTNGMPLQSIWCFQNALKYRQPQTQGRIHIMLSQVWMSLRNGQTALDEAQMALKIEPGNPYGFVRMGEALIGLGNIDGARQSFDTALRIAPQLPEAQQGMSFIDQLGRSSVSGASKH